jgi:hypothetical protein
MTENQLVTALNPLVGGRVYPDAAEMGTTLPYITWQQVGGGSVNYLGGGAVDKKQARIQINVWAQTRKEAMTLIRQIEDICVSDPFFGRSEGAAIARYESANLRGAFQDFSFWIY